MIDWAALDECFQDARIDTPIHVRAPEWATAEGIKWEWPDSVNEVVCSLPDYYPEWLVKPELDTDRMWSLLVQAAQS